MEGLKEEKNFEKIHDCPALISGSKLSYQTDPNY
jgi:hypothetical protein